MFVTTPQGTTHLARRSRRPGFTVLGCSGRAMDSTRLMPADLEQLSCKSCRKAWDGLLADENRRMFTAEVR